MLTIKAPLSAQLLLPEALGSRKLGFAMAEIDLAEIIKDVLCLGVQLWGN